MGPRWILPPSWPQPTDDYTLQPCNHYRAVDTFLARGDHFSAVSMISPALVWSLQGLSDINDRV